MIEPADLLREAKSLQGASDHDEVRRRSAVSRVYYAAFHHARVVAESGGYSFDTNAGTGVHAHLIRHFRQSPDAKSKKAARLLKELRGLRVLADYDLGTEIAVADVRDAIATATRIVSTLPLQK